MKKKNILLFMVCIFSVSQGSAQPSFDDFGEAARQLAALITSVEISPTALACALYEVQLISELPQDPASWNETEKIIKQIQQEIGRLCPDVPQSERERVLRELNQALLKR